MDHVLYPKSSKIEVILTSNSRSTAARPAPNPPIRISHSATRSLSLRCPDPRFTMTQAASTILAAAIVAAGYLCALCTTPPNPSPERKDRHNTDRVSFFTGSFATVVRRIAVTAITYHALLVVLPDYAPARLPQMCPRAANRDAALFQWSAVSAAALLLIYLGAYVRLAAYHGLGQFFTFHLAAPDRLVTTGVYRWIQHPSYLGLVLIEMGCGALFLRWDATPACWMAEETFARFQGWGTAVIAGGFGLGLVILSTRVRDEEEMLRQKFGQEWEAWHRSTKRFIPGLV
ncbi:uncharacterized protein N7459_001624 [Penicillium hispanicum]|uniref:uncharacterized protein n=1 Tax=Penicillium hispanicum TaxID=1080232 RepID=UPI002541C841|nr:uncharacterized protein N7459_001624 [Penicillium hispanicum]KAJ5595416.1 hypothetical protein N7459_001624 [Penicillium hispanicum]